MSCRFEHPYRWPEIGARFKADDVDTAVVLQEENQRALEVYLRPLDYGQRNQCNTDPPGVDLLLGSTPRLTFSSEGWFYQSLEGLPSSDCTTFYWDDTTFQWVMKRDAVIEFHVSCGFIVQEPTTQIEIVLQVKANGNIADRAQRTHLANPLGGVFDTLHAHGIVPLRQGDVLYADVAASGLGTAVATDNDNGLNFTVKELGRCLGTPAGGKPPT